MRAVPDISQTVPVEAAGLASATYTSPSEAPKMSAEGKSPRVTLAATAVPETTETLELSKFAAYT